MLLQFLGCPSSGKTTIAAGVFFQLKKHGFNSEFITEQARSYIVKKKALSTDKAGLRLGGYDQLQIFNLQKELEDNFFKSIQNQDGIIVADSSCINTLLYLSDKEIEEAGLISILKDRFSRMEAKFFYCSPVLLKGSTDPNRLHSQEESKKLDERMQEILKKHFPEFKICNLNGDLNSRVDQVMIDLISFGEDE